MHGGSTEHILAWEVNLFPVFWVHSPPGNIDPMLFLVCFFGESEPFSCES